MRHLQSIGSSMLAGGFRKYLLASTVALVALTAPPVAAQEIRAVMHSGLRVLDPITTTAHITRNHGYMIYDTLLGVDENMKPQPQMADWKVADDQLTYTFTLRDGLKFHDGKPVTAADVVGFCQVGQCSGLWQDLGHEHDTQPLPRLPLSGRDHQSGGLVVSLLQPEPA